MPYGRPTRAEILRHALAFALGNVKFEFKRLSKYSVTEADRMQIADDTIAQLRKYGGWDFLDEECETPAGAHGPARGPANADR